MLCFRKLAGVNVWQRTSDYLFSVEKNIISYRNKFCGLLRIYELYPGKKTIWILTVEVFRFRQEELICEKSKCECISIWEIYRWKVSNKSSFTLNGIDFHIYFNHYTYLNHKLLQRNLIDQTVDIYTGFFTRGFAYKIFRENAGGNSYLLWANARTAHYRTSLTKVATLNC